MDSENEVSSNNEHNFENIQQINSKSYLSGLSIHPVNSKSDQSNIRHINTSSVTIFPVDKDDVTAYLNSSVHSKNSLSILPVITSVSSTEIKIKHDTISAPCTDQLLEVMIKEEDKELITLTEEEIEEKEREEKQRKYEMLKEFQCDVCMKYFFRVSDLKRHMLRHSGIKPFVCKVCDKGFTQKPHLQTHEKLHDATRPFICEFCDKGYTQKHRLIEHVKVVHEKEKSFICSLCSKSFARKDTYKLHMRRHDGYRPFACNVCTKSFTQHYHYKNHMDVHHNNLNVNVCSLCGKQFSDKGSLRRHERRIHDVKDQIDHRYLRNDIIRKNNFNNETKDKKEDIHNTEDGTVSLEMCHRDGSIYEECANTSEENLARGKDKQCKNEESIYMENSLNKSSELCNRDIMYNMSDRYGDTSNNNINDSCMTSSTSSFSNSSILTNSFHESIQNSSSDSSSIFPNSSIINFECTPNSYDTQVLVNQIQINQDVNHSSGPS